MKSPATVLGRRLADDFSEDLRERARALVSGALGKIAVSFVEWSGVTSQKLVIGWTMISDAESARRFSDGMVDGVKCGPDGMRADVTGNLWCSSNAPLGYAGVLVFNPTGKLIGRIRLPEVCANLCFGGPKRDRLFMAASQSLYMLQVSTQGAAPG